MVWCCVIMLSVMSMLLLDTTQSADQMLVASQHRDYRQADSSAARDETSLVLPTCILSVINYAVSDAWFYRRHLRPVVTS